MGETLAEFDRHAHEYSRHHAESTRFSGEDLDFFARYKIDLLVAHWRRKGREPASILDFGTGIGNALQPMHASFPMAEITALDVSQTCLDHVKALGLPDIRLLAYDGKSIPLADASIDCIFTACVFHHIPATEHIALLREIRRVLKPGGSFMLFEHNPLNPLTRLAVARCPFDIDAVLISSSEMRRRLQASGFSKVSHKYCLFFPRPLAVLRPLERALGWFPLGAQYHLTVS